jgi:hypothetical protein
VSHGASSSRLFGPRLCRPGRRSTPPVPPVASHFALLTSSGSFPIRFLGWRKYARAVIKALLLIASIDVPRRVGLHPAAAGFRSRVSNAYRPFTESYRMTWNRFGTPMWLRAIVVCSGRPVGDDFPALGATIRRYAEVVAAPSAQPPFPSSAPPCCPPRQHPHGGGESRCSGRRSVGK